jgi:hypothetical protein
MQICRQAFPGYRIGVSLQRHPMLLFVFRCPVGFDPLPSWV